MSDNAFMSRRFRLALTAMVVWTAGACSGDRPEDGAQRAVRGGPGGAGENLPGAGGTSDGGSGDTVPGAGGAGGGAGGDLASAGGACTGGRPPYDPSSDAGRFACGGETCVVGETYCRQQFGIGGAGNPPPVGYSCVPFICCKPDCSCVSSEGGGSYCDVPHGCTQAPSGEVTVSCNQI